MKKMFLTGQLATGINLVRQRAGKRVMRARVSAAATLVLASGLGIGAGMAQSTNWYGGLFHTALGNGTLQVDPLTGALVVSGIGTNGTDGVSIATGEGGGTTLDLGRFNPAILPSDAWLRWRAIDPSDTILQELKVQATTNGGAFFADYTGLGAPTVSVALFSNDTLVATASGIPPTTPVATFDAGGAAGGGLPIVLNPCILHPEACYGVIDITVWQPDPLAPTGPLLSLPGQGPVSCTRLEISPNYSRRPPFVPQYRVKTTEITGNNLGTQTIANEGLVDFGLEHHAVGQAQYSSATPGALTVTGLGIDGTDGVDVLLQNANTYSAALNPQPLPPGGSPALLTVNATGRFAGAAGDQALGGLRVVSLPTSLQLWADLPAASTVPLAVELWQGGALVSAYFVDAGGLALSFAQQFTTMSVGEPDDGPWCGTRPPGPPPPPWWWSLGWPAPIQVTTPTGSSVLADHARVSPLAPGQSLAALTRVSFRAVGPQPLVFNSERGLRNGLNFEGNQHFALGNASLATANGQLLANNIGATGADGVEIVLGRANGSEVASPPMPLPLGGTLTYGVFADLDGIPDRPAGAMTLLMNLDGTLQATGDFSSVGATHFTVAVLTGDTLVARQTGLPGATFTIQTTNSPAGPALSWKSSPMGNGGYLHAVKDSNDQDLLVTQPFSPPVHGTRVVVIPEDPMHQLGPQSRLRVTGNFPTPGQPFAVATEKLNLFGHGHTASGSAVMFADPALLTLGNLGPGSTNGLTIDVGNSLSASVNLALDASSAQGPQLAPWMLQTTAFGNIGGQANQNFGSLGFLAITGTVAQFSADFSPVGSSNQTIEVWGLGQLVQRIPGHSGPVLGTASVWPVTVGVQDAGSSATPGFITHFGQPASISIAGGPTLQGDTLVVRPEDATAAVNAWQSLNLQAGGMNSFGIFNESDTAALTPRIAGIAPGPDGGQQISVPTIFGYLYTLEAASALSPAPVRWTPVQTFLGDGTTQVLALSNPAFVGGPQGFFRVRLGSGPSGITHPDGPLPDPIPPKHIFFTMDNVFVDTPHDKGGGDWPYFGRVLFQTQCSTPGSTLVKILDNTPHDWVSKNEYNGNGTLLKGKDHMLGGDSLPTPPFVGNLQWNNVQLITILDLMSQKNPNPPIMVVGAFFVGIDNVNTPANLVEQLLSQFAAALNQQFVDQVESGLITKNLVWLNQNQVQADLTAAFQGLVNTAFQSIHPDGFALWWGSSGNVDVPIGISLVLLPVIPGLQPAVGSLPPLNLSGFGCQISAEFVEHSPDSSFSTTLNFRGCGGVYHVNAHIDTDLPQPTTPTPSPESDPNLVDQIIITTQTGDDDLRSSSTAQATIKITNAKQQTFNLNLPNEGFDPHALRSHQFTLSPPADFFDIESITLHVVQGQYGGGTDDNWDVDYLRVQCLGSKSGFGPKDEPITPNFPHYVRLVAKDAHPENNEFVFKTFPFNH
jgi:hypothetical protein